MSLNTRKQRSHVYGRTFLKWTPERIYSTLQQSLLDCALAVHHFGADSTNADLHGLAVAFSDLETMMEVTEEIYPTLRPAIDRLKKEKLTILLKQTKLNGEAQKLTDKVEAKKKEAEEVPDKVSKRSPFSFIKRSSK